MEMEKGEEGREERKREGGGCRLWGEEGVGKASRDRERERKDFYHSTLTKTHEGIKCREREPNELTM